MDRRRFLALGAATGVTALTGCAEQLSPGDATTSSAGASDPGVAVVKTTGSLPPSKTVHSGWIHLVADGTGFDMTFDVRICHGFDAGVEASLDDRRSGRYEVTFSKTQRTDNSKTPPAQTDQSGCEYGTRINGSATLPKDLDVLTVTSNGDQLLEFEKEGGTGEMRPLPDPLSWS